MKFAKYHSPHAFGLHTGVRHISAPHTHGHNRVSCDFYFRFEQRLFKKTAQYFLFTPKIKKKKKDRCGNILFDNAYVYTLTLRSLKLCADGALSSGEYSLLGCSVYNINSVLSVQCTI